MVRRDLAEHVVELALCYERSSGFCGSFCTTGAAKGAGSRLGKQVDWADDTGAVSLPHTKPPVTNKHGIPYPDYIDPRTGKPVHYPGDGIRTVPKENRVAWGSKERGAFIKEWYDRGYKTPDGGWKLYDIHHIQPREYGGTNDFMNLVPLPRTIHQQQYTPWWRNY